MYLQVGLSDCTIRVILVDDYIESPQRVHVQLQIKQLLNPLTSWKCFGSRVKMCVCVSAPRPLITTGMIWCDIDCV